MDCPLELTCIKEDWESILFFVNDVAEDIEIVEHIYVLWLVATAI